MASAQPILKVIQGQNPLDYPEYFDFEALRRIGMDHISRFSGKKWTDHNLHDPGITMLEVLSYALLDLGYRSKLPFTDLLAKNNRGAAEKDDNFFTPAEILSCNPLTINDYRKLLLDIDGVRNAWVEPVEDLQLSTVRKPEECTSDGKVYLQGIYHVGIEPEEDLPDMPEGCTCKERTRLRQQNATLRMAELPPESIQKCREEYLLHNIKEVLNAHRNLCEDFNEPKILCRETLSICGNIELEPGADVEAVWVEIMRRFRQFVNPDIRYYTLQELLDKGKAIEEIFEGRPLSEKSAGFIDTEELENFVQPKEFHLSDLFRLLAEIPGVVAVEKLVMNGVFDNGQEHSQGYGPWIYKLAPNHYPRANFEGSCFNFSKNRTSIAGVSAARQSALTRERLSIPRKTAVSTATQADQQSLPGEVSPSPYSRFDKPIALGNYRSDLGTFISVQNDFPVVYGLGEGHLSELDMPNEQLDERQKARKAQALQLKGYLLFFDQLLANYAAQLANLRHLFSLTPDDDPARTADMQHTAFARKPDSVPLFGQLLRYYEDSANPVQVEGDPLVVPVHSQRLQQVIEWLQEDPQQSRNLELSYLDFELPANLTHAPDCKTKGDTCFLKQAAFPQDFQRDGLVEQWSRGFSQNNVRIETLQDACGFYFLIWSEDKALVLLSRQRYPSLEAALQASQDVLMLGNLPEIFRRLNMPAAEPPLNIPPADIDRYSFELVFRQTDYLSFLQSLLEDETLYCKRRNQFLDHILARFCEGFTDQATLLYEAFLDKEKVQKRYKNDKARYAQHYDDYSRNRGRAFDYTKRSWDTDNVSGLEAKTAALAGISNFKRKGICITSERCDQDGYYYQWTDHLGANLFRSPDNYPDIPSAHAAFQELVTAVREGDKFQIARAPNGEYRLSIVTGSKQIIPVASSFPDEASAKKAILDLAWSTGAKVGRAVVRPTKEAWRLDVTDQEGRVVRKTEKAFATQKAAESGLKQIESKGIKFAPDAKDQSAAMHLVFSPASSNRFLDLQPFQPGVFKLPKTYFWQRVPGGNRSAESWEKREQVVPAFAAAIEQGTITDFFQIEKKERAWRIVLQNKKRENLLEGTDFYPDESRCKLAWRAWRQAAVSGKITVEPGSDGAAQVVLRDANGHVLARSRELSEIVAADYPEVCLALLRQKSPDPVLEKLDNTFYGFYFEDDKSLPLLASFRLFGSALEAFQAMQQAPEFARKKEHYVLTGDEGNPDYTYLLRDNRENYIGYLPDTLEKPQERSNRQKKALAWFAKWESPLVVLQEADRFSFQWNHPEVAAPIIGTETSYLDENDATQAFVQAILNNETAQDGIDRHLYSIKPVAFDVEWNFTFQANIKDWASDRIAFAGVAPYTSIEKAVQAADAFASKLATAKATAAELGKQPIIQIKTAGNGALIQSPVFETVAERDKALAAMRRWIKWSASTVTAAAAVIPATPGPVPHAALSAQNPFIAQLNQTEHSCLKILKHDEPMAIHPDGEWMLEPGDKNCQKWYYKFAWKSWSEEEEKAMKAALKRNCGLSFFLDICLDGTGVTDKTTDCPAKYRFVFRNLQSFEAGAYWVPVGQILWQSVQTYETSQEAIAAFQGQYLELLAIASNLNNYGGDACIGFEKEPVETPTLSTGSCGCQNQETRPGIEVPWSTKTLFDGDESIAAYYLSESALSFPVFAVLHEAEQCDCGCTEKAGCSCKKIKTAADHCIDPAASRSSKFKFRLYDFGSGEQRKPGTVRWESTACYDTASEAMRWFKVFSRLLENSSASNCLENCHIVSACCDYDQYSIGISEVIVRSAPRGSNEPGPGYGSTATTEIDGLFKAIQSPDAFHLLYTPPQLTSPLANAPGAGCGIHYAPDCYSFCIAEEGYRFATHPGLLGNRSEALAEAKKAFEKIGSGLKECCIVEPSAVPANGLYFLKTARKDGFVIQLMCVNKTLLPAVQHPQKDCPPQNNLFKAEDILLLETTTIYNNPPCATPEVVNQYVQSIVDRFCALLADFSNFVATAADNCQSYTFELRDPSRIVGRHPVCYATATEARDAIQRARDCLYQESFYLLENILMRPAPSSQRDPRSEDLCPAWPLPSSTDCCLEWMPKPKEGCPEPESPAHYLPFTDPYSFWATVVIPCYTARFCQADFRRFFEETMRYEAPAHIALCYRWLSPGDICKFEKLYKKWLAWKSDCSPKIPGIDSPECALISFLQAVEDCPVEPVAIPAGDCCDCKEQDPVGPPRSETSAPVELARDCKPPDAVICRSIFKTKSE